MCGSKLRVYFSCSDKKREGEEAGLAEGVHYTIALRFAEGQIDRLPALVKELEAMKPAVFFTGGTFLAVRQELRPDIPVVFASIAADPIEYGLAQSYAKPGGRFTGHVLNALGGEESVTEKRIAHFKELVPTVGKLGLIGPRTGTVRLFDHEVSAARGVAERLGVEARPYSIQTINDLEGAVASALRDGVDAFYVSGEPIMITNLRRVVPLLASSGKPTLGTYVDWARAGLLMAYAADIQDSYRRGGVYVAKILQGGTPADLPIEQASKFTLAVNAKTAKRLGITIPLSLLTLADEVFE